MNYELTMMHMGVVSGRLFFHDPANARAIAQRDYGQLAPKLKWVDIADDQYGSSEDGAAQYIIRPIKFEDA